MNRLNDRLETTTEQAGRLGDNRRPTAAMWKEDEWESSAGWERIELAR